MNLLAWLLLVGGVDSSIQVADLDRFPAAEAAQQSERCQEHLIRLRTLQHVRGWENGFWQEALDETQDRLAYWQFLEEAQQNWLVGDAWACRRLQGLKEWIGPAKYRDGWAPPRLPEWPKPVAPSWLDNP